MPLADLGTSQPQWDVHVWIWTTNWYHLPKYQRTAWDDEQTRDWIDEIKPQLLKEYGPWHWYWIGQYQDQQLRQSEMVRLPW